MSCLRVGPYGQPCTSAVQKQRGGHIHRHAKSLNVVRPIFQSQIPTPRTPFPKPLQSDTLRRRYLASCPHGRFVDWPREIGVSEDDLERITSYSLARFEGYFSTADEKIMGNGPEDQERIFYQYANGKQMAYRYKLEDDKMREFLFQNEAIWQDIIEYLPKMKENWNIFSFVELVFKSNFRRFWDSYRSDYVDTFLHWSMAGAF